MQRAPIAQDKIFQVLADPSRRAIFESLTRGEAAVKDLTARFDISQPAVSQHLAALKDAGLVNGRREGGCVYYRVEPPAEGRGLGDGGRGGGLGPLRGGAARKKPPHRRDRALPRFRAGACG